MSKIKTVFKVIKVVKNWPVYFLDYFKLVWRQYSILKLRNGILFCIRSKTSDRTILNEIWLNNFYTPQKFEINENDIIFDLGSHIGFFSVFAAISAKKGIVYSFEPSPDSFKLLEKNISLNNIKNIKLINKAVACKSGIREFILSDNASGNHFASFGGNQENKKITVPTINLEEFIKSNNISVIDFLKMDCEEAEYEIIFNCSPEIFKIIKKISMEYHNIDSSQNATQLKKFLETMGFEVSVKGYMLYALNKNFK